MSAQDTSRRRNAERASLTTLSPKTLWRLLASLGVGLFVVAAGCSGCERDEADFQYRRYFGCDGEPCDPLGGPPDADVGVSPGTDTFGGAEPAGDTSNACGDTCKRRQICRRGRCVATCDDEADCPAASTCTSAGYCRRVDAGGRDATHGVDAHSDAVSTRDGFASAPDADADTSAPRGDATIGCTLHADCGPDQLCRDGRCVTEDICTSNDDCRAGAVCRRGECRPGCRNDGDCRPDEICEDDGYCRVEDRPDRPPRCTSSDDCEPCEICRSGVCEVAATLCNSDDQCGFDKACLDGVCHYECRSDATCPRGQTCRRGLCRMRRQRSPECRTSGDCADGSCIGGICYDYCRRDGDCGPKTMCDHGVCRPDYRPGPECRDHSDCPIDTTCVDGYCTVSCRRDAQCRSGTCRRGYCVR